MTEHLKGPQVIPLSHDHAVSFDEVTGLQLSHVVADDDAPFDVIQSLAAKAPH